MSWTKTTEPPKLSGRSVASTAQASSLPVALGAVVLDQGRALTRISSATDSPSSRVAIDASGETVECETGTLLTFDPGERHAVRGLEDARLLLVLAPWPAAGHNSAAEEPHAQHLPANATSDPIDAPPVNDETSRKD